MSRYQMRHRGYEKYIQDIKCLWDILVSSIKIEPLKSEVLLFIKYVKSSEITEKHCEKNEIVLEYQKRGERL